METVPSTRIPLTETDLFGPPPEAEPAPRAGRPLADRLRPRGLDEVVGQEHLLGPDGAITRMLARGSLASLILWGPPGSGKTTIARLLAVQAGLAFVQLSAVFSGVADLKRAFEDAGRRRRAGRARSCSSMRSIVSTARNRTASFPSWRTAPSRSSAPPPRIPLSRSTGRCSRVARCWCCAVLTTPRSNCCWRAPKPSAAARCPRSRCARGTPGDGRWRWSLSAQYGRAISWRSPADRPVGRAGADGSCSRAGRPCTTRTARSTTI